jgi:glycosyltransferase involved in cell wall biosynthesis
MRIFFLCSGTREFASTRLRVLQYLPELRARGFDCHVASVASRRATVLDQRERRMLLGDRLVAYADKLLRPLRWAQLAGRIRGADVLLVQRALGPIALQARCAAAARRCLFDLDDGIHLGHPQLASAPRRQRARRERVAAWLRLADRTIAASSELAREWPDLPIAVLPTPVDCQRVRPATRGAAQGVTIGWIGSPPNAAELEVVRRPIQRLRQRHPDLELLLVGGGAGALASEPAERRVWSEPAELEALGRIDVGIMPLADSPWNRLKGGYKLLLYMAAGLPVVASPVGVNRDLVREGESGYLAAAQAAWEEALERLILDPALRARLGSHGRRRVESEYSVTALAPRLAELLREGGSAR